MLRERPGKRKSKSHGNRERIIDGFQESEMQPRYGRGCISVMVHFEVLGSKVFDLEKDKERASPDLPWAN